MDNCSGRCLRLLRFYRKILVRHTIERLLVVSKKLMICYMKQQKNPYKFISIILAGLLVITWLTGANVPERAMALG